MNQAPRSADERIEQALREIPRAAPATDLSARIVAQLPQTRAPTRQLRVITFVVALLGVLLAYRTAFDLYTNGAFELLAYYTAQPAIVTTYPRQAFGALAQAIPWLMIAASTGMLASALYLVFRITNLAPRNATQRA